MMTAKATPETTDTPPATASSQQILDTALVMADQHGWEALRLYQVADQLEIPLTQIQAHFDQKDALIDAWFDRADQAMLTQAASSELRNLPEQERLESLLMHWLQALAPHQEVSRQMIEGKLEPGHLHIQIAALLRVSRTVQWWREGALRDGFFIHRAIEETLLTSLFIASFSHWLFDHSKDFEATRRGIQRRLKRLGPLLRRTQSMTFPQPLTWLHRGHHHSTAGSAAPQTSMH